MSDKHLPALPHDAQPETHPVSYAMHECREAGCGERGEWFDATRSAPESSDSVWDFTHKRRTGHNTFFLYQLTRRISGI